MPGPKSCSSKRSPTIRPCSPPRTTSSSPAARSANMTCRSCTMTQTERAELLYTLGLAAIKQGDVAIGKSLLEDAIDTHPQYFEAAVRSLEALGGQRAADDLYRRRHCPLVSALHPAHRDLGGVVSDMKFMKIPNKAVLALMAVFAVVGLIALPLDVWAWRWAHFLVIVLVIGFVPMPPGWLAPAMPSSPPPWPRSSRRRSAFCAGTLRCGHALGAFCQPPHAARRSARSVRQRLTGQSWTTQRLSDGPRAVRNAGLLLSRRPPLPPQSGQVSPCLTQAARCPRSPRCRR